ncbi:MAG: hypothetical protein D6685_15650 [Bacteroidetes bacterium]|nr:MAG: hypothetical protein D6685_15650 [Bacteroidota bacterium]
MAYVSFHEFFPEIAERETRIVTLFGASPYRLPPGQYALFEMYCDEPGCDCRRVFFSVVSSCSGSTEAIVAYGWEPAGFYASWANEDDPELIRQLKGPVLNLASPQSVHAPEILRLIREILAEDPAYVERLRTHYDLFRRRIEDRLEQETQG